ncbi:Nucleotidyl transferase AbiEii toxin, Type IV TA system [Streptomyces sp. SolWspMP-sol7th]|nr:Nucleotidyl transferase AbiEii toxin, Type IV TA system [Streptomyces sp. SolWspMP-sol7th]
MNLSGLHQRLLRDVLAEGRDYPLALTGGYAVQAHGLVDRISQDLDVATENPGSMEEIVATVRAELERRGWAVRARDADPLSARLLVVDPASNEQCEVDILKEVLWGPLAHTEYGLVLSLQDVVGTKIRALADRGLARDLIDAHAAAGQWSPPELEELGRRHARDE